GKNIYPGPIEDMFKTNKWIDQLVVIGERQPFMAALVVPDYDELEKFASEQNLEYDSREGLIQQDEVQQLYRKQIRNYSTDLASHEKIRDFRLVPEEFSVETGELTPTLKVKRRIVEDKYSHLIDDMFQNVAV
ncbi:MAG: long-chain fatty acid--CoA ligase, partial [Balneolaceae bacterium]|nr:long-chain fatty acid--CoA ligase [Balneolaceae bacterium]